MTRTALALVLGAGLAWGAAGCERAGPQGHRRPGTDPATRTGAPADTLPELFAQVPTLYATHWLFVAASLRPAPEEPPLAVVLHFVSFARADGLRRDYRGWLVRGGEWTRIAWDRRDEPPTRRPWRVFPARGLRLVVGEQGEVDVAILRTEDGPAELAPGPALDRWEDPDAAERLVRDARLDFERATWRGVLLEERVARPNADVAPHFLDHTTLLLQVGRGDWLVVSQPRDRQGYGSAFAWASFGGVNRRWDRVEVQGSERVREAATGRELLARWTFAIPEPGIRGEVASTGVQAAPPEPGTPGPLHAVHTVTGWVESDGGRRPAAGIVEQGEP
jgi:hypothetical protein